MAKHILTIENFSKSFRSHWTFMPIQAVKHVSLEIEEGESFGFLGHNGAGKTTTIKTIVNLIKKSAGSIRLDGVELPNPAQHKHIGYLPEHPYFYDHLTVGETLEFFAQLHEMTGADRRQRIEEVLEMVKLGKRRNASVRSLSKGLQQRLGFAQAILNRPRLLLLDEPFSGLDPLGRLDLRRLILEINRQGTTIFMSSHILSDVEDICNRVAIMAQGELRKEFYLRETPELFGSTYHLTVKEENCGHEVLTKLKELADDFEVEDTTLGSYISYEFREYPTAQAAMEFAINRGTKIEEFKSSGASLEEIFMDITNAANGVDSDSRFAHDGPDKRQ